MRRVLVAVVVSLTSSVYTHAARAQLPPPAEPLPAETFPAPNAPTHQPELRDNVIGFYSGVQIGISPGIGFSTNSRSLAFSLGASIGYGIDVGPVVLIPSLHVATFFSSDATVLAGMPSAGFVLPVGPVGIRIDGGVGPGVETRSGVSGVAWRALASVSVHPTPRTAFGVGAEYTYIAAANLSLIGPVLILAF